MHFFKERGIFIILSTRFLFKWRKEAIWRKTVLDLKRNRDLVKRVEIVLIERQLQKARTKKKRGSLWRTDFHCTGSSKSAVRYSVTN